MIRSVAVVACSLIAGSLVGCHSCQMGCDDICAPNYSACVESECGPTLSLPQPPQSCTCGQKRRHRCGLLRCMKKWFDCDCQDSCCPPEFYGISELGYGPAYPAPIGADPCQCQPGGVVSGGVYHAPGAITPSYDVAPSLPQTFDSHQEYSPEPAPPANNSAEPQPNEPQSEEAATLTPPQQIQPVLWVPSQL